MRLRPTCLAVFTAVFVLGTQALLVRADNIDPSDLVTLEYKMTLDSGVTIPNPGTKPSDNTDLGNVVLSGIQSGIFPQVKADISAPGSVVSPSSDNSQSPLTVLSTSQGLDQSGVVNALSSDNSQLGLIFFNQGVAAGGELDFTLSVNKAVSTDPVLTSLTPGVTFSGPIATTSTPTTPTTGGSTPDPTSGTTTIPEPLSVFVWSILAG
ncbi:hypothetical protein ACYOEI_33200, partial [Singulisphaera rosea]